MSMTVIQKPLRRSRELKTPIGLGSQSDTSHLAIRNFQGCIVSSCQGTRTRISFRTARSRISIALSGNALARGVARGERARADPFHVSRIHEQPRCLWPRVMTARSLCLCAVSAGRGRVYPPSFPRAGGSAYPHLFRVHKCAEGDAIVSHLGVTLFVVLQTGAREARGGKEGKKERMVDERSGIKCKKKLIVRKHLTVG